MPWIRIELAAKRYAHPSEGIAACARMRFSSASVSSGSASSAAARFSRRWSSDDVPGISRMLGARCSSQASATCIGVAPRLRRHVRQRRGLQRREAAEREERHIGDAVPRQLVDQRVVVAVREVVLVLHADDRRDGARFLDLRRRRRC